MMTAGSLYVNLKNWDFGKGKFSLDESEAITIRAELAKNIPMPVEIKKAEEVGNLIQYTYVCPVCGEHAGNRIGPQKKVVNYCIECGQRLIRPKEEANENREEETDQ